MERKPGRGARKKETAGPSAEIEELDDLLGDDLSDQSSERSTDEQVGEEAIALAADVPVQVVAVLGKKTIALRELLAMQSGELIDLGRPPTAIVDLVANGKLIAKGELVEIDGKLGVRIVKMVK
ncbi:MAG: FliM/FliN family flagellar motor switch protein [Deltaproteobacteria bacterium]|nr:FliM/FliN family flagellar motor switch protein [Deltaproteobacteria bacterium]